MAIPAAVGPLVRLAVFGIGLAVAASPWYMEGGVFGGWQGLRVRPETDILGIQTFAKFIASFISIALGLLLCNLAGLASLVLSLIAAVRDPVPPSSSAASSSAAPWTGESSPSAADDGKSRSPPPDLPSIGEGI